MSKEFPYNLEKAQEEAAKMQANIKSGKVKSYEEAQKFIEKYTEQLEQMGVKLLEEALVPDYYNEEVDALYKVYEIK